MQSITPVVAQNSNDSFPDHLIKTSATVVSVVEITWALTILIGVVGNVLLGVTICFNASLQTAMNTYVLSIGVVDFVTCAGLLPLRITVEDAARKGRGVSVYLYDTELFLRTFTDVGRLLLMQSLTFERYQAIANPFAVTKAQATRRARVVILIQGLLSLSVAALAIRYFCDSSLYNHCSIYTTQFLNSTISKHNAATSNNITTTTTTTAAHRIEVMSADWGLLELYVELPLTLASVIIIFSCYSLILSISRKQKKKLSHHSNVKKNQISPSDTTTVQQSTTLDLEKNKQGNHNPSFDLKMDTKGSTKINTLSPDKRVQQKLTDRNIQFASLLSLKTKTQGVRVFLPRKYSLPGEGNSLPIHDTISVGSVLNSSTLIANSGDELNDKGPDNKEDIMLTVNGANTCWGIHEFVGDSEETPTVHEYVEVTSKESLEGPSTVVNESLCAKDVNSYSDLYLSKTFQRELDSSTPRVDVITNVRTLSEINDRSDNISNKDVCSLHEENEDVFSIHKENKGGCSIYKENEGEEKKLNEIEDDMIPKSLENTSYSAVPKQMTVNLHKESKPYLDKDAHIISQLQCSENKVPKEDLTGQGHNAIKNPYTTTLVIVAAENKNENSDTTNRQVEDSDAKRVDGIDNTVELKNNDSNGTVSRNKVEVFDIDGTVTVRELPASINQNDTAISGAVCLMTKSNRVIGRRRLELKAALKVGFLFLSFVCLWMPLPVSIGVMKRRKWTTDQTATNLTAVFSALATFTAAIDPVVYGLLNGKIREGLLEWVKRVRSRIQSFLSQRF